MKMQKKWKIELLGVARAFIMISKNGPRSKKFGHPWCIPYLEEMI